MTADQRRAINRQNARKSTGPKTPEGKERTRQNALKHGLCAAELALPTEDAEVIQAQFDEWIDQYQPVGPAECALVEEIAKAQLRLRRCTRRETAVLEAQIVSVNRDTVHEQEDRLAALQRLLVDDPATAGRELKRFGIGRRWLLERWRYLGRWFLGRGSCGTPELVNEAIRLLGASPKALNTGPVVGFKFKLYNSLGMAEPDQKFLSRLLADDRIHPEYFAELSRTMPDQATSQGHIRAIVRAEIAALEALDAAETPAEQAALNGARRQRELPADTADNRLALRYETTIRAALHKAMHELDRLQDARFAAEAEAATSPDAPDTTPPATTPPVVTRNEAEPGVKPPTTPNSVPTCDACENTISDVPKAGGMPTSLLACSAAQDIPTKTWACHPPEVPAVTVEGADSPQA